MLIQFNFNNFKSFCRETSLDMTASKITEHSDRVVNIGGEKLLRLAAIYGANASGKSNVFHAFQFMVMYVLGSFNFGDTREKADNLYQLSPFLFDNDSKNEKSTFEVFFIDQNDPTEKTYQYGFAIKDSEIVEEWLNYKSKSSRGDYKTIFYRGENNALEMEGIPKKSRENIEIALEKEVLVVSLGSKLKIAILKKVMDWFIPIFPLNFGISPTTPVLLSFFNSAIAKNNVINENVLKFLHSFDNSIVGFEIEKALDKEERMIFTKHKVAGTDEITLIPLFAESAGTQKMLSMFIILQSVLATGSVLFIDELNSQLHPLLVRNIILTFANPEINTRNAQLIFITHDIWQLSTDLFRRDEIWFTEKDNNGVSSLYCLADFADDSGDKIRKDENYLKNYILGKYGAIPDLKTINFFNGE